MNDQINELKQKATDNGVVNPDLLAELIIRECARLQDSWGDSGDYLTFGQRMSAYFGIKE